MDYFRKFLREIFLGDADEGLKCIRRIPRHAYLKNKAVEGYMERLGTQPNSCGTCLATFVEVFVVCYGLYILDLAFDIDLIKDYKNKSETYGSRDNISVNWTGGGIKELG